MRQARVLSNEELAVGRLWYFAVTSRSNANLYRPRVGVDDFMVAWERVVAVGVVANDVDSRRFVGSRSFHAFFVKFVGSSVFLVVNAACFPPNCEYRDQARVVFV